jgi:mono/diheme cytochrome c family protein
LGVKTRQINRVEGDGGNQLARWARLGFFDREAGPADGLARLYALEDQSAGVEARARSFLDANCAHCHRPGGVAGNFDARFDTPLARQNLIGGRVLIDLGIDGARAIAPRDPWRSIVLNRVETTDQTRMPPLAHEVVDRAGAAVLREWIASMPGPAVVAPPSFEPKGGEFARSARVTLRCAEPGAVIRYTLDGSLPGPSAREYQGPIELTEPVTVRARAYKDGMTRSVVVQETFVVGG